MKNTIALFVLLMIAFAASAVAQNTSAKDLFASKCAMCHGPDGSAQTTMGKNLKYQEDRELDRQAHSS